jgi:hypothetical protein
MNDLKNDPGEMKNIYLRPKYKTIKNSLENNRNKIKKIFEAEPETNHH